MTTQANASLINKVVFHNTLRNEFPNEILAKLHACYEIQRNNSIYYIDDCDKKVPLLICEHLTNNKYELRYVTGEVVSMQFDTLEKSVVYCKDNVRRYLSEIDNLREKQLLQIIRVLTNKKYLTIKIASIDSVNIQVIGDSNVLVITSATNKWRFFIDKSLDDLAIQFIELMNNYMNY
jgi:hypothetical protein